MFAGVFQVLLAVFLVSGAISVACIAALMLVSAFFCVFESAVAAVTLAIYRPLLTTVAWIGALVVTVVLVFSHAWLAAVVVGVVALIALLLNDRLIHGPIRHLLDRTRH